MAQDKHDATLYLRGLPKAVVRESKARAARQGMTLTAYVTEILARAAGVDDEDPVATDGGLAADRAWYLHNRDRLAEQHEGSYLAVLDQQVVDHDAEFAALARRVRDRFGRRPVLMPKCVSGGRVVTLPSPRIARS
ncbi:MAG: hypothetical protein ACRDU8_08715 [Egibacteraceae bacterium]